MTVRELLEQLRELHPDDQVLVRVDDPLSSHMPSETRYEEPTLRETSHYGRTTFVI
jgi:hypothetical protein